MSRYHAARLLTAGGNEVSQTYPTDDRDEVRRRWDADAARSRQEDGDSYSGEIGMLVGPIVWNDLNLGGRAEARDRLMETHGDKWGPPAAVSFTEDDGTAGWVVGGTAAS